MKEILNLALKQHKKDGLWPHGKGRAASYRISRSLSIFVGLWITRLLYLVFSWSTSESFPHNWLVTVLISFWVRSFNRGLFFTSPGYKGMLGKEWVLERKGGDGLGWEGWEESRSEDQMPESWQDWWKEGACWAWRQKIDQLDGQIFSFSFFFS